MKTPKLVRIPKNSILTLAAALIMPAATGLAQNYWQGPANGSADYNVAANWVGNAVPTGASANPANDNGSNSVILIQTGDPAWSVNSLRAGWQNNASGSYLQTGGTVTTALKYRLGAGNSGTANNSPNSGSFGFYTISNGVINSGNDFNVGELGTAVLNVNGGNINVNGGGNFAINNYNGTGNTGVNTVTDVVNQTAGIITIGSGQLFVGNGGPATYNLSGGSNIVNNFIALGRSGGNGTLNMTGGWIAQNNSGDNFLIGSGFQNPSGGTPSGVLNQSGGTITDAGKFLCPEQSPATGIYNLSGTGALIANNMLSFGNAGGVGVLNMTGGTITGNTTGGGSFEIGVGTVGTVNQSGGTVTMNMQTWVGQAAGGVGTFNMNGGAFIANNWFAIGRSSGSGTVNLTNGYITHLGGSGDHIDIGAGPTGGTGVLNQYGGAITNLTSETWIGEQTSGTWNFNGGTAVLGKVVMCVTTAGGGTLNLNGGLFQATQITTPTTGSTVSILNLNGGTLQANASTTNFISGLYSATVSPGSVIDSQSYNVAIPQALADNGGGSITKNGNGTLTLAGANTYTGATTVNAGTVATTTASTGGGNYSVASGAGLSVQVVTANASLGAANLTFAGSATLGIDLNTFGTPASAPLNVVGTLTASGTITVNILSSAPLPVGQIPLVQYGSPAGLGVFVLGTYPPGETGYLTNNAGLISLIITGAGAPRWDGSITGGVWDMNTTANWVDLITSLATTYHDGEPVVFDDNASGTTTVNLGVTVAPGSINFNNSSLPYSIVGTGKITGNIGLNLNGTANVSILNTGGNNFTGPVMINAGTLTVTNLANGGSPSALGASSASPTNLVIGAGTLQYTGVPVAVNRGFTANAVGSTIDAENNFALSGPVVAGATAGFVKTGPAQLALTASGTNQLGNNFNPGTQVQQGALLLDGSVGGQINHNYNEMWIGCTTTNGGSLILTNTTLNVDNWIGLGRINGGINNTSSLTLYNSALKCGNLSVGWDGGLPNNLSSQFITLNGNSTFTNSGAVNLPEGANSSMTFTLNSNSVFWVQNPVYICKADNTTGSVVVANSSRFVQVNGWFDIGQGNDCVASVLVKNNANLSLDGDCNLADTAGGANGTLTVQDNATMQANNLFIGKSSVSVCTANIAGSAVATFGNFMRLADGTGSTGNLNISGGSLTFGQYMNMAAGSGSTATITMSGGTLTGGNDLTVGDQATATVTLNGGVLTVPNTVYLSRGNAAANGTVNLNANGTIVCGNINNGWAFSQGTNSSTFNPNAFNFNGGTLKPFGTYTYIFPNVNVVVQAGGAIVDVNTNTVEFGASLVNGGGGGELTKLGSGILRFNGTNTYTGTTRVSAGILCGFGTIAGPVNVASGAALLPGTTTAIGTLTINNSLTFSNGSTAFMKISLDGGPNNDMVSGLSSVSYGGSLMVSNIGVTSLAGGGSFQLFNASSHTGNFSSVTVLPSGSGTFNPATGILTITSTTGPTVNPPVVSNGNLILTGSGGTAGAGYTWLSTTNLTIPAAAWITNTTGTFSGTGTFSNSIPVNYNEPARFYLLRTP